MKGKYLIGLGVSLLAIGTAAGFVGTKRAVEAKADGAVTSVTLKGSFDGWTDGEAFTLEGNTYTLEKTLAADVQFKIYVTGESNEQIGPHWTDLASWPTEYLTSVDDGYGAKNFKVTTAATFVFTVGDTFYTTGTGYGKVVNISVKKYTITKYAVLNGEKVEDPIDTDTIDAGSEYAIPDEISRFAYTFGGWYTDVACTESYAASTPAADLSIYAKYTCTQDRYIYYMTQSDADTPNYIYSFHNNGVEDVDGEFGAFPGKQITSIPNVEEVHGVLRFENINQKIYKIPYSSSIGDTHFVLNVGNNSDQTGNMVLTSRACYWYVKDKTTGGPNTDAASALEFLLDAEAIRNAATYNGHQYSICGVSKSDASSLYATYTAFDESIRTKYIDASYTYTYADNTFESNTSWSYYYLMQVLYQISTTGDGILSIESVKEEQTFTTATIITLAAIAGVGIIGFAVYRRRKIRI